ncbi:cubilin homolog [Xenia sp. Carnegie-2017]|uniref:cubilin homolog n=1 Tax=Xenia sp. Carnegie-2017 TaxID=2897299 RepID=UPI001F045A46|nr:cubilin homolog [Xenia sp. Carnegie-2017]
MGLAFNVFFVTFIIIGTSAIFTEAKQSSHCLRGITVKDILMLAGIKGAALLSYVAKMKAENIDQTVLSSLTYKQLGNIGISKIGDRHKLHKFLSKDGNDCNNSVCKNKGICRDGFRCFSCICDPTSGYYGLTCQRKCPCLNGGVCKTVPTGFKCVCPPGYSGDLCKVKYLTEERLLQLENSVKQLSSKLEQTEKELESQKSQLETLKRNDRGTWRLRRTNEILNQLEKLRLHLAKPTYTQKIPIMFPQNTRAIIISVYCHYGNHKGAADLYYVTHQKGNDDSSGKVEGYNLHYNVHGNTFLYEQMIPWNNTLANELVFKVTYSRYESRNPHSWYRVRLVGYVID